MKILVNDKDISLYDINELKNFSSDKLKSYINKVDRLMLDDPTNYKLFEYTDKIYRLWIDKDRNNETAYHMYLDILNLTNHYFEAYSVCQELMENNKFEYMVYRQLIDFGYVCDGVFSFDEHLDYIRKCISICRNSEEKKELEDLLAYEEKLWK